MLVEEWQSRLSTFASRIDWPRRVFVIESCESTQDQAAALFQEHQTDLAVFTLHQTKGRGRLGRSWQQQSTITQSPLGVAVTFALSSQRYDAKWLPIRAAFAAFATCYQIGHPPNESIKIKWPNDIVTSDGKKLGGILVEKPASLNALLVGIGLNVEHNPADLPAHVCATSLRAVATCPVTTLDVAESLIFELARKVAVDGPTLERLWPVVDALTGSTRTFLHNNQSYTGVVMSISPTEHIKLRTDAGIVTLPAASTTLVKD